VVFSFSDGERMVALAAGPHLSDAGVSMFAQHLVAVHNQADADLMALDDREQITTTPSALSNALDQTLMAAQTIIGDQAFLASQVQLHREALVLIDCVLSPAIADITLESFVVGPLRSHLTLDLQAALGLSGANDSPDGGTSDCSTMCTATMLDDAIRATVCARP
jgi:predicted outer membrane protein